MWRTGIRLPLSAPGWLAGGIRPGRGENRCEEAVLVTFSVPEAASGVLAALEDAVDRALRDGCAGELEAVQPGPGRVTVLTYGPDAERVWTSIEPAVRACPCRPAQVTLRYGLVGAPDRTLAL